MEDGLLGQYGVNAVLPVLMAHSIVVAVVPILSLNTVAKTVKENQNRSKTAESDIALVSTCTYILKRNLFFLQKIFLS